MAAMLHAGREDHPMVKGKWLIAAAFVLALTARAPSAYADPASDGEAACFDLERKINLLADFTRTTCLPGAGTEPGTLSLILVSSEPVFSVEAAKKAWLLAAVAIVGLRFRENPAIRGGEIVFSDNALMQERMAFSLPVPLASTLQAKVASGAISLDEMWISVARSLADRPVP